MKRCLNVLLLALVMSVAVMGMAFAQEEDDSKGQNAEKVKLYKKHIYWIDEDTEKIYVSNVGESEMHVFSDARGCGEDMIVKDGFIYYYSHDRGAIVKLSIVGKNQTIMRPNDNGVRDFAISGEKIYFIQEAYLPDGTKKEPYLYSMGLNGEGVESLEKTDCRDLKIYDGKIYLIKDENHRGIYTYDILERRLLKISESCVDEIYVHEGEIYVMDDAGVSVMKLDDSELRTISNYSYDHMKFHEDQIYLIDKYEIEKINENESNMIYESEDECIEGIVFEDSKLYMVNSKGWMESDVLNPETDEFITMKGDIDSAFVENGKIYYDDGMTLKYHDIESKAEKVIDTSVDQIWGMDSKYIYYSAGDYPEIINKMANLENGETMVWDNTQSYLDGDIMDDDAIYYFECDDQKGSSRLVRMDIDGLEKTELYSGFSEYDPNEKFKCGDFIIYDTDKGIFKLEKSTGKISEMEGVEDIIVVVDDRIYSYDFEKSSIYSTDMNGKNRKVEVGGIESSPIFNGRYFYYYINNYENKTTEITVIDRKDYSRRIVEIDSGYFGVNAYENPDAIYFENRDSKLMKMDMSDLSVKRLSDGKWRSVIDILNKETIVIERYKKTNSIKTLDLSKSKIQLLTGRNEIDHIRN